MTASTDIKTISVEAVRDYYVSGDFRVLRLALELDVARLNCTLDEVLSAYVLVSKDGLLDYRAICLQYAEGGDRLYGSVASMLCDGESRPRTGRSCHRNEAGRLFDYVFDRLLPLRPIHGRILLARPGLRLRAHRDYFPTLHIPIVSHPEAYLVVDGETFHLAADGCAYVVNSRLEHYMENRSVVDRYHLGFYLDRSSVFHHEAQSADGCVR